MQRQAEERKLAMAQQKTAEFIRRSQELCQAQTDFLQSLPELELHTAFDASPAASTKVALILPTSSRSRERSLVELGHITARSLTTDFTPSILPMAASMAALSASL